MFYIAHPKVTQLKNDKFSGERFKDFYELRHVLNDIFLHLRMLVMKNLPLVRDWIFNNFRIFLEHF